MSTADILQGLGVAATLLAVLAALFGARWFPPILHVKLDRPRGKFLPGGGGRLWFCLRVNNARRWQRATEVSVILLQVEMFDGRKVEPDSIWEGMVPLQRSLPDVHPSPPTVGPDALFDLFMIMRNHELRIFPMITPSDLKDTYPTDIHLRFVYQAHSHEADSKKGSVRVDWDGGWGSTDAEWDKHLTVTESLAE